MEKTEKSCRGKPRPRNISEKKKDFKGAPEIVRPRELRFKI